MKAVIILLIVVNWIMLTKCYLQLEDPDQNPVRMWVAIWETRNIFGKLCSLVTIVVTLPAIIGFYVVHVLYAIHLGIQYLGIKKYSEEKSVDNQTN